MGWPWGQVTDEQGRACRTWCPQDSTGRLKSRKAWQPNYAKASSQQRCSGALSVLPDFTGLRAQLPFRRLPDISHLTLRMSLWGRWRSHSWGGGSQEGPSVLLCVHSVHRQWGRLRPGL